MPEPTDPSFIYICTQKGAENSCKKEIARQWPKLRFAFSRPGFLTFKLLDDFQLDNRFDLKSVFARCSGFSGNRIPFDYEAEVDEAFEKQLHEQLQHFKGAHVHVWSRDTMVPGTAVAPALQPALGGQQYTPGTHSQLARLIDSVQRVVSKLERTDLKINRTAGPDDQVFDLIMVEAGQIWTGWHYASTMQSRWPGGIPKLNLPEKMISRAFLKASEALDWSRLPLKAGDTCVEIGSAPGGTVQALIGRGAHVIGIDPAEMDPAIAKHASLTFIRGRGSEVRCRDLSKAKWLFIDANNAPQHSLDTVERIVMNQATAIRGMLLTIKLTNYELAEELPQYLDRVRGWGFSYVRARQLAFQRDEFCIAAFRNKAMVRLGT